MSNNLLALSSLYSTLMLLSAICSLSEVSVILTLACKNVDRTWVKKTCLVCRFNGFVFGVFDYLAFRDHFTAKNKNDNVN